MAVIICLDRALLPQPSPTVSRSFIPGTLIATTPYCTTTGTREYRYTLQYDTTKLLVPATPLHCSDIKGVFCKGCLTTFIEETAAIAALEATTPLAEKA